MEPPSNPQLLRHRTRAAWAQGKKVREMGGRGGRQKDAQLPPLGDCMWEGLRQAARVESGVMGPRAKLGN